MAERVGSGLRVLVSGATGLIGRHVVASRTAQGDEVVPLWRHPGPEPGVHLLPDGKLDPAAVAGFDAVVHLAGEPIAEGRWTPEKKRRILDSRVLGTQNLVSALAASGAPPRVFVCASGIDFYGNRGNVVLDETSSAGQQFLSTACIEWERAANALAPHSRVVTLRIAAVLSSEGGSLAAMLPLFRAGLAGPIAGGRQYVSWVTLNDVVRAIDYVLTAESLTGPVNLVAPEPVTGRDFTAAIAASVGKPAILPVPAWAARLMLGELADETVLASVRAVPRRLVEDGFVFDDPQLTKALERMRLRKA